MRKLYAILIEQFLNGFLPIRITTVMLALLKIKHKSTIKVKWTQHDILLMLLTISRKLNKQITFHVSEIIIANEKTNNFKPV